MISNVVTLLCALLTISASPLPFERGLDDPTLTIARDKTTDGGKKRKDDEEKEEDVACLLRPRFIS